MTLKSRSLHVMPTWEGDLDTRFPQGFLDGSGITIDYAKQPSLWNLAGSIYKVAKEQGWTREDAQGVLREVLTRAAQQPAAAEISSSSPYYQEAVRLVKKHGPAAVKFIFWAVGVWKTFHTGEHVTNIDASDHRVQIEQTISLEVNEFGSQDEAEQRRRINEIVRKAIEDADRRATSAAGLGRK